MSAPPLLPRAPLALGLATGLLCLAALALAAIWRLGEARLAAERAGLFELATITAFTDDPAAAAQVAEAAAASGFATQARALPPAEVAEALAAFGAAAALDGAAPLGLVEVRLAPAVSPTEAVEGLQAALDRAGLPAEVTGPGPWAEASAARLDRWRAWLGWGAGAGLGVVLLAVALLARLRAQGCRAPLRLLAELGATPDQLRGLVAGDAATRAGGWALAALAALVLAGAGALAALAPTQGAGPLELLANLRPHAGSLAPLAVGPPLAAALSALFAAAVAPSEAAKSGVEA